MLPFFLIVFAFLADRLSKSWALSFLDKNGSGQINPYFTIRETYNQGIAFGLFQGIGPIVGWLSIIVVGIMVIYLIRLPRQERVMRAGLALVIGGALGNLVDRISAGQVLDFIQTPFRTGIFNVADVMIQFGMVLILASTLWARFRGNAQENGEISETKASV